MFSFLHWSSWFFFITTIVGTVFILSVNKNHPTSSQARNSWLSLLTFFITFNFLQTPTNKPCLVLITAAVMYALYDEREVSKSVFQIGLPIIVVTSITTQSTGVVAAVTTLETVSLLTTAIILHFLAVKKHSTAIATSLTPALAFNYVMYLLLLTTTLLILSAPTTTEAPTLVKVLVSVFVMLKVLINPLTFVKAPFYTLLTPRKIAIITTLHVMLVTPLSFFYLQLVSVNIALPSLLIITTTMAVVIAAMLGVKNIKHILIITTPLFVTTIAALFI